MMKFRRSNKSAKSQELKSPPISIPEKDAIAIQPPKKVIRALYDYRVENPQQHNNFLSFTAGDFLHVVGRENDPDWYEACNPLHGIRGLVPVGYFEEVGKQVRKSTAQSATNRSSTTGGHDSGYSEKTSADGGTSGYNGMRGSHGKGGAAVIYGMVLYDFKAERTDELDARAGEPIIIVAQSNNEWFVAKPITRLGGPGLIPVSFIEIRDSATQKPVEDNLAAVQRAGVPKVEEWKKMAAEYKNSSIPLGRLDSSHQRAPVEQMERLSVASSGARPSHEKSRHGSDARPRQSSAVIHPQPSSRASQMIAPVRARVPGYTQHHGEYWFNVEASMEDGRKWSLQRLYKDFYALQLALMEQFPDAAGQIEGIERTLPFMPGPVPFVTDQLTGQRQAHLDVYLAQLLKIRVDITNCQSVRMFFFPRQGDAEVSNDDRDSGYRQSLSSRQSAAIRDSRHSSVSGGNTSNNNIPQSHSPLRPQQSTPDSLPENMHPQHLQQQQYLPQAQYQKPQNPHLLLHQLTVPHSASPPPILRNGSALSMVSSHPNASYTSLAQQPSLPQLQSTHQQQPHPHLNTPAKVKVWFGDTNCVVVRLPPQYTYPELLSKLRERWALEQQASREEVESVTLAVDYKDENTGAFYTIEGEEDLSIAKEREKLTLRVMAISPFE